MGYMSRSNSRRSLRLLITPPRFNLVLCSTPIYVEVHSRRPASKGLRAQAVNMTSPLLHFAGKYQDFIGNPAEDLLRHLPSIWDETIVLPGSAIGKTAAFARRHGREWYIGVLNGGEAVTLQIDLSFLSPGAWQAEVYGDNPANPATFNRASKAVKVGDKLTVSMIQRGGAVVWITKSAR